jgi:hypothetical protein
METDNQYNSYYLYMDAGRFYNRIIHLKNPKGSAGAGMRM